MKKFLFEREFFILRFKIFQVYVYIYSLINFVVKSLTKTSFTNCEGKKSLLSIICIICKSFLIFHVSRVNNPRTCCIFTTKVFPILLYPCITRRNRSNGTKTINELQRCLWSTLFSTWFVSSSSFFFFHPPNYRSLKARLDARTYTRHGFFSWKTM